MRPATLILFILFYGGIITSHYYSITLLPTLTDKIFGTGLIDAGLLLVYVLLLSWYDTYKQEALEEFFELHTVFFNKTKQFIKTFLSIR